jgi:hypothetical protein
MKSWICASRAAATTSSRVAPGRPYAMLYSMLSLKSTVSCGTMPMSPASSLRHVANVLPSTVMRPAPTS